MLHDDGDPVKWMLAKIISAWALIGVATWAEAASFVAFVYSCALLGEWCWKRGCKVVRWWRARHAK